MSKKESLRTWRRYRNLTQEELADRTGVNHKTISIYETKGLKQASVNTLLKLVEALGISLDQLDIK